jgi:hypothetical protein
MYNVLVISCDMVFSEQKERGLKRIRPLINQTNYL